MTITQTNLLSNMEFNYAYGRHLDDAGTPAAKTITLGFRPKKIVWMNQTDRIRYEWWVGDTNGTTIKTVAAGTVTLDTADVAISVANTATGTAPVTFKPTHVITIGAAAILQNKQYVYEVIG